MTHKFFFEMRENEWNIREGTGRDDCQWAELLKDGGIQVQPLGNLNRNKGSIYMHFARPNTHSTCILHACTYTPHAPRVCTCTPHMHFACPSTYSVHTLMVVLFSFLLLLRVKVVLEGTKTSSFSRRRNSPGLIVGALSLRRGAGSRIVAEVEGEISSSRSGVAPVWLGVIVSLCRWAIRALQIVLYSKYWFSSWNVCSIALNDRKIEDMNQKNIAY